MGRALTRVGVVNTNTAGNKMTIIRYVDCMNIDVQFEDGTIVKNKTYKSFKEGNIKNPNYRIGEEKTNNKGLKMTIVEYIDSENIKVRFEDGTEVTTYYKHFKSGNVRNPKEHLGEILTLKDGRIVKILKYERLCNLTVELDDGTIVNGVSYSGIKRGKLK